MNKIFTKLSERHELKPHHSRNGAVLLGIMWILFLCALFVVLYIEQQQNRIRSDATLYRQDEMRVAAYSAFEITLGVLHEYQMVDGKLYGKTQGWGDAFKQSQIEVAPALDIRVDISDETGKIPINQLSSGGLINLFSGLDIDAYDTRLLVDSLLDWVDQDQLRRPNGAEAEFYRSRGQNGSPPNRKLKNLSELKTIHGFRSLFFDKKTGTPNGLYNQLQNAVSVHHQQPVNVNSLDRNTFDLLFPIRPAYTDSFFLRLHGPDTIKQTADDGYFEKVPPLQAPVSLSTTVGMLRVQITVKRGNARFDLNALVSPQKNSSLKQAGSTSSPTKAGNAYPFEIIKCVENRPLDEL